MTDKRISQAVSTVHGGRLYGGDEVVAQAIIGWLIEGEEGQLFIRVYDPETETEKEATIRLEKFVDHKATVERKPD